MTRGFMAYDDEHFWRRRKAREIEGNVIDIFSAIDCRLGAE
jgi:hypothetical protein